MKDDIAVASVILTIVAVVLLVVMDSEAAARVLEEVSPGWFAPWTAAEVRHLDPLVVGHPRAPEAPSTTAASAGTRREVNVAVAENR